MSSSNSNNRSIIGIDVAKDKLDVYFLETGEQLCWKNTVGSINAGLAKLKRAGFKGMVVLEATGGYEKRCQQSLVKAGIAVHVAHPRRVHYFIKQKGYYGKTDEIDAKALAEYGYQEAVSASPIKDKKALEREDLSSRRAQLVEQRSAEKCRYKEHLSASVKRSLKRSIKVLDAEIIRIEHALEANVNADEQLKAKAALLLTYKGVGQMIGNVLLSTLPELGSLNRRQIACLCGLAPRNCDSGRRQGKRMIMGGRSYVRKVLYMSALSSIVHNPVMRRYYQRLIETGKAPKVCLTAVMRKIIITLNAMIRDSKPWQQRVVNTAN